MRTRLAAVGEEIVPDEAAPIPAPPATPWRERTETALGSLLFVTLKTLSQKTLIALTNLADMGMIASAFVLWLLIIRDPTPYQLAGAAGYAVFVLACLRTRRVK